MMNFPLARCAVLWLGCMVGCTSSLRGSIAQNEYDHAQQGLRRLNAEYTTDSTGPQAGYVGLTRTSRRTVANEDGAYFGVPPPGTEEGYDTPVDTSVKSSKGTKNSKKGSESSSKGSKKSSKGSGKSSKSSNSDESTSSTRAPGHHHNSAPTASPRHHRDETEKPTTANNSDGVEEKPTPDVDERESVSDFPSQAPTCKECDDGATFSAANALAVEQAPPNTRHNVTKVVVAVVLGIIFLLLTVLFLTRSWRRGVIHSRIEATHDDTPAHDSKFSDSDVTVVLFEDDDEEDDAVEA